MLSRAFLPPSRQRLLGPAAAAALVACPRQFHIIHRRPTTITSHAALLRPTARSSVRSIASKKPSSGRRKSSHNPSAQTPYSDTQPELEETFENVSQRDDKTSGITPEADTFEEALSSANNGPRQPTKPLPDLTKGIPSTLEAELRRAQTEADEPPASLNVTEHPDEPIPGSGGRAGDGPPRDAYISSSERKKNALIKYTYLVLAGGLVGWTLFLGRNWESEVEEKQHLDAPSGWGLGLFYSRVKARTLSTIDYYKNPTFAKLLPDEEADPNQRAPFTLVLSLEDLLVHQEWTRETGWRIAKRPGVDYFIRYLRQYYELVLFTSQPSISGDSILRKLDPYRIIAWPLFREATLYQNGEYIKDLSYLNRDLSKVVMIDTVPSHAKNQPDNAIILPKWTGDPTDQTLVQLIPFLEYLATMGFSDTRKVIQSFEGTYIPAEFAKRERLLRQKFEAKLAEERQKRPKRSVVGGISSALGGGGAAKSSMVGPDGVVVDSAGPLGEGEMLWDQIRRRGQKQYELIDKQIREEGQSWLDEMAAQEKKFQEEAKDSMKGSVMGFFWPGGDGGGSGSSSSSSGASASASASASAGKN